ncbi:MAG TPA: hypothetical protein VL738_42155 [Dactylosporangium sp.]|jgi:hypothetical protein|nr:hypothetical protein [Dactylosporangium sp.]
MMTPQQRRAVRVVVGLLVAGLALGLTFAALTLLFRGDVLAYQRQRHPDADPGELADTLWTRPIPILVVAGLYVWVARQLLAGAHRAYRRVRVVSVLGFVAVGWLFLSAEYPAWLRAVQGVQLAVFAALIVAVNRPVVRAAFPPVPDPRPRNRRAALLLAVLAPVVAEVTLGTVPLRLAWAWLVFAPVYSAGAVFVREVVRRTGRGYPNLLLMGIAYGLLEEGLALQSLTSPNLYHAADWAPRLFGVNTAYTELNLVYHAVFSIAVPIALTELCFARHGTRPYLRRGGVIAAGVVALLGAALLRVAVPPGEDPGYNMALPAVLGVAAAIAVLAVVALRVRVRPARPAAPPRPAVLGVLTAVAALVFLGAICPFAGARQPLFTHGAWALLPMAGAAAVAAAMLVALRRWGADGGWTPRHTLAACVGALAGHSVFGLIANAGSPLDRAYLAAVAVLTVLAGARYGRLLRPAVPGSRM